MMRSARDNSFRFRSCGVVACLLAVVAMAASAISACACTHHEMRAAVEPTPSCHSSSHGEPASAAEGSALSDSLRSGCSCFVSSPAAAVAAKSESKSFSAEKLAASREITGLAAAVVLPPNTRPASFDPPALAYFGVSLASGPSRAPPRL